MPASQVSEFVQHLRTSVLRADGAGLTDGKLLECFLERRDQAALEVLVRRHGPMVWGVCRRLLNHHDAEDAFQATFLVLVRRAVSIMPREMVGNWLYGVAHQTALKARSTVGKRKRRERQVADMPEPVSGSPWRSATEQDVWSDLQPFLDHELCRLPDKYRAAILLCDLDGKTRKEAAQQLSLPEGTIASRLTRARGMLAKRLSRHGLAIPAGAMAVMLTQNASACVPTPLLSATIKTARLVAAGKSAAAGAVSAKVVALTEGVLRTMLLTKLKITMAALMMVALTGYGFTVLVRLAPASGDAKFIAGGGPQTTQGDQSDPSNPEHQRKPSAGKLLVFRDTGYVLMTSDGKKIKEFPIHLDRRILSDPVLSPDGRRVAFALNENPPTDEASNRHREVLIRDLNSQDEGFKVPINALSLAWMPDGKGLIAVELLPGKEVKDRGLATWLIDMATKQPTRLDLPRWMHAFAVTPDGKSFVGAFYDLDARKIHLALASRDGKEITKLTELHENEGPEPKPSTDGTRILFQDFDPTDKVEKDVPKMRRLFVYDLRSKKSQRLPGVPLNAWVESFCWSPDGKRLAYTWKQVKPGVPLAENTNNMNDPKLNTQIESFMVIADADGSNPKTILSGKSSRSTTITIGKMDWR
jgi:RNA polymerase sigma factor (sigma-70 family)